MSLFRHAEVRSESLTGLGYIPDRIPAHHVERETGYRFRTSGSLRNPPGAVGVFVAVFVFSIFVSSCDYELNAAP